MNIKGRRLNKPVTTYSIKVLIDLRYVHLKIVMEMT